MTEIISDRIVRSTKGGEKNQEKYLRSDKSQELPNTSIRVHIEVILTQIN